MSVVRFLPLLLLLSAVSCEDGVQSPLPERIALTLVDVAVREAYLRVAVSAPAHNETLVLKRDGAIIASFAAVAETTIADTGLTRATVYGYSAILVTGNEARARSNAVSARTLSPASRDFTWQTFLFGDGSSALYDVAIVNDTLVYAVGEIYLRDSLGNLDPEAYNLLKWDGTSWQLLRVQFYVFCGQQGTWSAPARSIFSFSASDIMIAMDGSQVVRWNGETQSAPTCTPVSVFKLWGENPSSVWAIGRGGRIARYDGTTWGRIESGTTTDILDVWGVVNPVTRSTEVYCAVSSFFVPGDRRILKITSNTAVDSIQWEPQRRIWSVWTRSGFPIYAAGSGVFENSR